MGIDAQIVRGLIINAVILLCIGVGCYFVGRSHNSINSGVGSEFGGAAAVNTELEGEQQRAVATVARIRELTTETTTALDQLGELNRGSADISAQIRQEATLLADYLRNISNVIGDGNGGE